ncbi:nuclear protein localization protein 4 homolog [Sycon ciliatum]|uniref:nuclear protein localization protein 4 homolog n=1 Tax=Sycon ciliatum TaxID=27933 RepID=UPI0020AD5D37|eukprot:scpid29316/ scgid7378/ Nuclear protein localization protein 4 homolog
MIVRVQSSEGTKRVEVDNSCNVTELLSKVALVFEVPSTVSWSLCRSRNGGDPLYHSDASIASLGFKNGEMIYLSVFPSHPAANGNRDAAATSVQQGTSATASAAATAGTSVNGATAAASSTGATAATSSNVVEEDEIDKTLAKSKGTIERGRDAQFCRHGDQGRCIHCTPIQPYDPQYLAKQEIKHMSFHSYVRKLHSGVDKGKFVFLENLSCKIKPGCTEHSPWPNGICTKCQPNAVTLKRQEYRHVDNIMFEDPSIMDRFLQFWRTSGQQRMGILYGKYTEHKDVPLGIKAVVSAIYEPPQVGTANGVRLLPDENDERIQRLGQQLGLRPVGWVFSDLESEDRSQGTVKYFRHMDSYFISAEECIMAADYQARHPSPCKYSTSGYFGSKFSTVVVSGGVDNQICMEGYQVTDQCMALVNDECFVPTVDAPELGYIKESTIEQYVPDVFYKIKDEYNSEVTKIARPLPVEYLLVQVPVAAPVNPTPMFAADISAAKFPIENRSAVGEVQEFPAFRKLVHSNASSFLDIVSSFHVLAFMACCDMMPIRDTLMTLCQAVVNRDHDQAARWCQSPEWATVQQVMDALGDEPMAAQDVTDSGFSKGGAGAGEQAAAGKWECAHCTYRNSSSVQSCEMCTLPREA